MKVNDNVEEKAMQYLPLYLCLIHHLYFLHAHKVYQLVVHTPLFFCSRCKPTKKGMRFLRQITKTFTSAPFATSSTQLLVSWTLEPPNVAPAASSSLTQDLHRRVVLLLASLSRCFRYLRKLCLARTLRLQRRH